MAIAAAEAVPAKNRGGISARANSFGVEHVFGKSLPWQIQPGGVSRDERKRRSLDEVRWSITRESKLMDCTVRTPWPRQHSVRRSSMCQCLRFSRTFSRSASRSVHRSSMCQGRSCWGIFPRSASRSVPSSSMGKCRIFFWDFPQERVRLGAYTDRRCASAADCERDPRSGGIGAA